MKKSFLVPFVKGCIVVGMLLGVGILVLIAFQIVPFSGMLFPAEAQNKPGFAIAGVLSALCVAGVEYIALTLYRMMQTLERDPFVERNVTALRRMGFTALMVSVLALMTLLFVPVPLAIVAALPIGMCGLFSLVLSNVFQKAVMYKAENDLTV